MNSRRIIVLKLWIAGVMLSLLALLAGQSLAPDVPLLTLWLWALGGLLTLGLVFLAGTWLTLTFKQWVLRKGGTDTQWLWFTSDPPGLERPKKSPKP
jgi:hypothetical protein